MSQPAELIPITKCAWLELGLWDVQRRDDGAVLVRVHSSDQQGRSLPDAVFAFRLGDPQYDFWEEKLRERRKKTGHDYRGETVPCSSCSES